MNPIGHIHWTEDEELLERFVLGRVEEGKQRLLETHLASCDVCRSRVEHERMLLAGAKRLGRIELKDRLALRVGRTNRRTRWIEVMSAAAVVLVAFGIAVFNRWITFGEEQAIVQTKMEQEYDRTVPAPAVAEGVRRDAGVRKKTVAPTERYRTGEEDKTQLADAGRKDDKRDPGEPMQAIGEVRADQGAGAAVPSPASVTNAVSEQWIEGVTLGEQSQEYIRAEVASNEKMLSKAKGAVDRQVAKEESVANRILIQAQRVQIQQRQISDLPTTQQRLQARSRTVQTLVDHVDGRMRLTLYLDPPATDQEIQNAQVRQIRPDSLIVTIGTQQIGYRIPAR